MLYLIQAADDLHTTNEELEAIEEHVRALLRGDKSLALFNFGVSVRTFDEQKQGTPVLFLAEDLVPDEHSAWLDKLTAWWNGEADPVLAVPFRLRWQWVQ
jgi:hypothetical protein